MSANDLIYQLGITQIPIGISLASGALLVIPPTRTKSVTFKWSSGGSLVLLNAYSLSAQTAGYLMGTSEVLSIGGPAPFFAAAGGSTAIMDIIFGLTPQAIGEN